MLSRGMSDAKLNGARGAVLVVDDDASIRGVVRQALEAEGWQVLEAAEGAAGLSVCEREQKRLALVLLDLRMPTMNGGQFAERYWSGGHEGRAPLVVFTATSGIEAAEEAERLRAVGFVIKPFELDELLAVVERCARPARESSVVQSPAARRIVSRVTSKPSPGEMAQQRQMEFLRTQLVKIQEDMGRVRLGVTEVTKIEMARRLTREETRRASQLRMESERLRYELSLIRDEFYRLKDERRRSN